MNQQILQLFTYSGSLFHKQGAAHRKERAPQDFANRGSVKSILLFERNKVTNSWLVITVTKPRKSPRYIKSSSCTNY